MAINLNDVPEYAIDILEECNGQLLKLREEYKNKM